MRVKVQSYVVQDAVAVGLACLQRGPDGLHFPVHGLSLRRSFSPQLLQLSLFGRQFGLDLREHLICFGSLLLCLCTPTTYKS